MQLRRVSEKLSLVGKRGTHEFDGPAEDGRLGVLLFCQFPTLQDSRCVDNAEATVQLATWDVVVEILSEPKRERTVKGIV